MIVTVDRINNGIITVELENGQMATMSASIIPEAKEGDIIDISINKSATDEASKRITDKMNELWAD